MDVRTERLVLTPVGTDDVADLVRLHGDPNVAFWNGGGWTAERAWDWATGMAERWLTQGVGKWMARLSSDATLVGRGGLSVTTIDGEDVLELGWAVRDSMTGRGFATEIGRAAVAYAFETLGAARVVAFTEIHNAASRAVMKRLGMRECGTIHRPGLVADRTGVHANAPFALYELVTIE